MGSRDICVGHFCHPVLCVTVGVWLTPYAVKIGLHMSALKVMSFSWRIFTFPFRIFIEPWCSNNWTVSRKYSKFWRRSKMKHLIKIQFSLLQSNTKKNYQKTSVVTSLICSVTGGTSCTKSFIKNSKSANSWTEENRKKFGTKLDITSIAPRHSVVRGNHDQ